MPFFAASVLAANQSLQLTRRTFGRLALHPRSAYIAGSSLAVKAGNGAFSLGVMYASLLADVP